MAQHECQSGVTRILVHILIADLQGGARENDMPVGQGDGSRPSIAVDHLQCRSDANRILGYLMDPLEYFVCPSGKGRLPGIDRPIGIDVEAGSGTGVVRLLGHRSIWGKQQRHG